MITIHANNVVTSNGTHIGSVAQEAASTVFFDARGARHDLGVRIVLSTDAGWEQLDAELSRRGLIA